MDRNLQFSSDDFILFRKKYGTQFEVICKSILCWYFVSSDRSSYSDDGLLYISVAAAAIDFDDASM